MPVMLLELDTCPLRVSIAGVGTHSHVADETSKAGLDHLPLPPEIWTARNL